MSLTWTPATDDDPEFTVTTATQHSVLAGRSTADAHPASAITTDNDWNGNLTSAGTNLAAVLDAIDDLALGGGAVDSVNGETGTVVLDAADVGAAPTSRTITAGTGLTGGGDLSANRTLTVAYGSTAGTAAQGNDSRLSDARTPTAHAASHATGGSDEITISTEQVTGLESAGVTGSPGLKSGSLADWWTSLAGVHTAPASVAIIGDSKTEQDSPFSEGRSWSYLLEQMLNGLQPDLNTQTGYRAAIPTTALIPGFTTNAGAVNTGSTVGRGTTLTTGQTATLTATMDGISIVYTTSPGAGSIEVRDGVGGPLLDTIDTNAAAKSGRVWTSGALASASHTIELTSVGTTVVDGAYVHSGNRANGVRVWKLARAGATNADYVSTPAWGLDFIENNAADLDLVILAGGTNDIADWDTNTRDLLDAVLATGYVGPIALLIPEFNQNLTLAADHQTAGHAIAVEYGLAVIDMAAALQRIPIESSDYDGFTVHQGAEGQALYARTALAVLSGDPFGADHRADRIKSARWQAGAASVDVSATAGVTVTSAAGATGLMNSGGFVWNNDTAVIRTAAGELLIGTALGAYFGTPDGLLAVKTARLAESASDVAAQAADRVALYAKNDGGRSRLYTRDDVGVRGVAFVDDITSGGIPATIIDAAGDLIVGTAADTAARLAVGTSGQVLTSNGTTATWATPASVPAEVFIGAATLHGSTTVQSNWSTYPTRGHAFHQLNDSATSTVGVMLGKSIPWTSVDIYAVAGNPTAGGGGVRWTLYYGKDAGTVNTRSSVSTTTTLAAGGATYPAPQRVKVGNAIAWDTAGDWSLVLSRLGSDGADTLATAIFLQGLVIRQAGT